MIFFYCCVLFTVISVYLNFMLLYGFSTITQISKLKPIEKEPRVAIIIPVRNEEADVEQALESICNIRYSNHRIIVLNDRSTDNTPEILERVKSRYPQIELITITELPDGWLGKNNAMYQAYKHSDEEWLLFTDADINFHPDTLSKAMSYTIDQQLDNLVILPELQSRSTLLNSVFGTFGIMLMIHMKPWKARDPKSKASTGIGAFSLVKRTAYEAAGTHERIKQRPDDDIQLGINIKSQGLKQDVLAGRHYLRLEWYKNLRELELGLRKNTFSVSKYNLGIAAVNTLITLFSIALPLPIMFIFGDTAIRLMAGGLLLLHMLYMIVTPPNKWWYALMIPFSGFVLAYIFVKATVITVKQGGIYWRGSFYPLEELRKSA